MLQTTTFYLRPQDHLRQAILLRQSTSQSPASRRSMLLYHSLHQTLLLKVIHSKHLAQSVRCQRPLLAWTMRTTIPQPTRLVVFRHLFPVKLSLANALRPRLTRTPNPKPSITVITSASAPTRSTVAFGHPMVHMEPLITRQAPRWRCTCVATTAIAGALTGGPFTAYSATSSSNMNSPRARLVVLRRPWTDMVSLLRKLKNMSAHVDWEVVGKWQIPKT